MVTQATVNERIDNTLSTIAAEIEDLPAIAAEWPHMLDDHQAAFLLEWDELMARFESLDRPAHTSQMNPTQHARYRTLLRMFGEAMPVIERLGLPKPQNMHTL